VCCGGVARLVRPEERRCRCPTPPSAVVVDSWHMLVKDQEARERSHREIEKKKRSESTVTHKSPTQKEGGWRISDVSQPTLIREDLRGEISVVVYTDETVRPPPPLLLGTRFFSDNKKELERRQRERRRSRESVGTAAAAGNISRLSKVEGGGRSSTCADCQLPHSRQTKWKRKKKRGRRVWYRACPPPRSRIIYYACSN
jgi:hypothetical protein